MKRFLSMLLAAMLLLTMLPAMAEQGWNPMPPEMSALFEVPAWEGYEVMMNQGTLAWTYSEELDAGVVIMTDGSLHVVCIVEPDKAGNLRITQRNYTMVTGNDVCTWLESGYGNTAQEIDLPWGFKQGFELCTDGYMFFFAKFDGVWRVKVVLGDQLSFVFDDRIGYREGEYKEEYIDWDHNKMRYVYGTYDNRFAAFNIEDFPKTYDAAREKLTNPPLTPSDFYTPENITLRAREKYDVFSAPGRSSYRPANGKAVMSTNDWVQIFGEEDGWLLVQYDISREQMRFGYIDASALPRNTQVHQLTWYDLPEQTITRGVNVTDDPLASCSSIHWLDAGDKVNVLAEFGTWYYIEVQNGYGKRLRGFIPQTAIELITWADMKG